MLTREGKKRYKWMKLPLFAEMQSFALTVQKSPVEIIPVRACNAFNYTLFSFVFIRCPMSVLFV